MDELVTELADAIRPLADVPFSLFGHSMGAIVAFELAAILERNHKIKPKSLLVSGCRAPHRLKYSRYIYALPDDALIDELRAFGGTPPDVLENDTLMRLLLPSIRADLQLIQTYGYNPGTMLSTSIHSFAGTQDDGDPPSEVRLWEDLTTSTFTFTPIEGNHFFIFGSEGQFMSHVLSHLL
jgi:Predicted thioesterase involved in non-ribosomal peptide biosynthesis